MIEKYIVGWIDSKKKQQYTLYSEAIFETYPDLGKASKFFFEEKNITIASVKNAICLTCGVLVNKEGLIIESTLIGLNPRMQGAQEEFDYFNKINDVVLDAGYYRYLDEVSYCLNAWDTNYQHFIVETLPKIHASQLKKNCPIVVLDMPFIREIVEMAYSSMEFIFLNHGEGIEADLVHIPMPVVQNFEPIVDLQVLAFENLRSKILYPVSQEFGDIYLARMNTQGLAGHMRRITNDSEVMDFFVKNDFKVDDFVEKTLIEKMVLTAQFKRHITPIGANLINYLFAQNPIDLYVFSHPYFTSHQYFINLFAAMKLPINYHILPAGVEATGSDNWVGVGNSPYRIDMDILITSLHLSTS